MPTKSLKASLSLYLLTFNCAKKLIDTQAFASQFFNGIDNATPPDLIVISLQEISTISSSFIGGSLLVPQFTRIQDAVELATKKVFGDLTYRTVVAKHTGLTGIIAFARDHSAIQSIETAEVAVGLQGMGNKGAVGLRFEYHDSQKNASTEMTFVGAHLTAMEDEVEARNEDWKKIVRGLVFTADAVEHTENNDTVPGLDEAEERPLLSVSPRDASIYKPTSHLFVAGDLNYRTSIMKPSPEDPKTAFPQPGHATDSAKHFMNLFENDQLNQELKAGRTLHGLVEAPVDFPPTYKYTSNEPFLVPDDELTKWHWASHRWPSWCDRILYLPFPDWMKQSYPDAQIVTQKYTALPLFPTSDHRAVALSLEVPLISIAPPNSATTTSTDPRASPPYDIDPDWKQNKMRGRHLELIVGVAAYLTTTWEGGAIVLATIAGSLGGFFLLRAALDF